MLKSQKNVSVKYIALYLTNYLTMKSNQVTNQFINLKDASKLTNKSPHTIRKLAQDERISSKYNSSTGTKKLLVNRLDLIEHYGLSEDDKKNEGSKSLEKSHGLSPKYLIETHNQEKKEIREHYEKLLNQQLEAHQKQIENLERQLDKQRDTHEKQMAVLESIVKTKNYKELQSPNEENNSEKTNPDSPKKKEKVKKGILARLFSN